jgi:hypothetical protein
MKNFRAYSDPVHTDAYEELFNSVREMVSTVRNACDGLIRVCSANGSFDVEESAIELRKRIAAAYDKFQNTPGITSRGLMNTKKRLKELHEEVMKLYGEYKRTSLRRIRDAV